MTVSIVGIWGRILLFINRCGFSVLQFGFFEQRNPMCDMPVSGVHPWRARAGSGCSTNRYRERNRLFEPAADCKAVADRSSFPVHAD